MSEHVEQATAAPGEERTVMRRRTDMKMTMSPGYAEITQASVDMIANDAFDRIGAKNRGPFSYEIIVSCDADMPDGE